MSSNVYVNLDIFFFETESHVSQASLELYVVGAGFEL